MMNEWPKIANIFYFHQEIHFKIASFAAIIPHDLMSGRNIHLI
jgi:hypothetical protein